MAQHPKLTAQRQDRLIAIIGLGESLSAAARAIDVSTTVIRNCAQRDPLFAERLAAAREHRVAEPVIEDWEAVAARLEREHPEHWSLPSPWGGIAL